MYLALHYPAAIMLRTIILNLCQCGLEEMSKLAVFGKVNWKFFQTMKIEEGTNKKHSSSISENMPCLLSKIHDFKGMLWN